MTDKTRNDDDDPRLLSGAYALDAITPSEAESFEAAAEVSPALRDETDGLVETATLLGRAAVPVTPSPRMKTDLLSMIASTPQLSSENETSDEPGVPPGETVGAVEGRANDRWFRRPSRILTAAAAAVVLFVGGGVVGSVLSNGSDSSTVSDASATRLAEISAAADAQRASATLEGGGAATLVWSNELGRSAVLIDDLPPLSAGKVYEAWYIDESGATAAGTFTASGNTTTWHVLDGTMSKGDTVGVTIEPAGGSPQPTTDPIVVMHSA